MDLGSIFNNDGMSCQYSYVVCHGEELFALDLVGADTAVKAVYATLIQKKRVKLDASWRQMSIPKEHEVSIVRTVLEADPMLLRWHIVPRPTENDLAVIVYGWDETLAADAFIGALGRWTVWPTLPEWAEALYELGRKNGLVYRLDDSEGVDYAFSLATTGWDAVIAKAVKEGLLPIPA